MLLLSDQQTINTWHHKTEHHLDQSIVHSGHKCQDITHSAQTLCTLYSAWRHIWLKQGLLLCPQTKGVLHYVRVSLLIPLYPLCCSQSSAMTSLHLSWQVTVLRQHSTQQGSLNLPTICQSPKTSSVMSSPPCQSWWHIKFVSGNSVGDYNLIQHCLEPMGRTRQLLWDIDYNVNVGRPHANNYKYDIFPRALTLGIIAWQYEGGVKTQEGTFLKRWV